MSERKIIGIILLVIFAIGLTVLLVAYAMSSFIMSQLEGQQALESAEQNMNTNTAISQENNMNTNIEAEFNSKELRSEVSNTITVVIYSLLFGDLIVGMVGVYLLAKK